MMRKATAALYLDISVAAFERQVALGDMPHPIHFAGRQSWSKKEVDAALEVLMGGPDPDWRSQQPLYQNTADDHSSTSTRRRRS